ncbi:hypothetical protein DKX38_002151 [Salix brachista]|uniref:Bifunctional inhibitor/plant lipid transfer protein/seed storage helical domain-containing protein n=1 Tax=Salix brachista TaxID=2182728 RepID=A0A5N5NN73_9ROSI|nr:hypothetical protein DKX38_002151 [Salix brachista]
MASKGVQLSLMLILTTMLCYEVAAQSGCTTALIGLAPCLNYVTGNSSTPSSSCCSQLTTVVQSQPQCLCTLVNGGGSSFGIAINQTLALALPGACNVQTPPASRCNAANVPATSPASSPLLSPPADSTVATPEAPTTVATPEAPTTVATPRIPAGSGSKTVPASTGTSDASIMRMQFHLTIFVFISALGASGIVRF